MSEKNSLIVRWGSCFEFVDSATSVCLDFIFLVHNRFLKSEKGLENSNKSSKNSNESSFEEQWITLKQAFVFQLYRLHKLLEYFRMHKLGRKVFLCSTTFKF